MRNSGYFQEISGNVINHTVTLTEPLSLSMPPLATLQAKFPGQLSDLDETNTTHYESLNNNVRLIRQVLLAWSKTDLQRAIHDASGGSTVSAKTIGNVEEAGGSEKSCRRIMNGLNKGLKDRSLPALTFLELFPSANGSHPPASPKTTAENQ